MLAKISFLWIKGTNMKCAMHTELKPRPSKDRCVGVAAGTMCPLFPLHLVLVYACGLVPLWLASSALAVAAATAAEPWGVQFDPTALLELQINEQRVVRVSASQPVPDGVPVPASDDDNIARPGALYDMQVHPGGGNWTARFNVTGHFIGYAKVSTGN